MAIIMVISQNTINDTTSIATTTNLKDITDTTTQSTLTDMAIVMEDTITTNPDATADLDTKNYFTNSDVY